MVSITITSISKYQTNFPLGMVRFHGALVDVRKLMSQLERSDKARTDTETCMVDLKSENNKLLDKVNKSNSSIKHLNSELKEYKDKLKSNEELLSKVTVSHLKFCFTAKLTSANCRRI